MPASSPYLADLAARGLLPAEQAAAIAAAERSQPFSLHYELRALLYLGITLLAGGLGVLVYQHIDSIGHGVIIALVAAGMAASFAFAAWHRAPFTWGTAGRTSVGADYLLLLGCLLLLVLEGYVQYQYQLFGQRYGLATALPALLFIPLAYLFDHRGVLAMGLTALASWLGLTVAPLEVLTQNDFGSTSLRGAAIGLGLLLMLAGFYSQYRGRKAHFAFTYLLLGSNLALLALATALVQTGVSEQPLLGLSYVVVTLALCAGLYWYARQVQSYWFLVLAAGYAYFAACYVFVQLILQLPSDIMFLAGTLCFPLSALAVVMFFVKLKTILHGPASRPSPGPSIPRA